MDHASLGRVGVFGLGLFKIKDLGALIGARSVVLLPGPGRRVDTVVAWGRKRSAARAEAYSRKYAIPLVRLEDGFVRSMGLGVEGAPPMSIVVDDEGIYYDSTRPSALESLLRQGSAGLWHPGGSTPLPALRARAKACMETIVEGRLSKYNRAPEASLGPIHKTRVLVIDQTAGDLSVRLGGCVPGGFDTMLTAAIAENAESEILVKTHPDVNAGKRSGHSAALGQSSQVTLLTEDINPIDLLRQVDKVYCMTSLMGFEALMVGKPVVCFGMPFYAGWGLTDDRATVPMPRRAFERTLDDVFAAAYLRYARYINPHTGEAIELESLLSHLGLQRTLEKRHGGKKYGISFSSWKRGFVPSFLRSQKRELTFCSNIEEAAPMLDADSKVVLWGTRESKQTRALIEEKGAEIWRMEDGFLRSVGLGSDLFAPASLVLDRRGIYYDPRTPSDLEVILADGIFPDTELERARTLRQRIVDEGLSKYSVGSARKVGPSEDDERQVVLVIGQVQDDASIQCGCLDIKTNGALLREARARRPDAYLMFKPHPDVVSGNRREALPLSEAREIADEVVIDATLDACLRVANEVHTMTSLVGFEALLRDIPTVVYGQPFYAGWGLSEDRHPHPRRKRKLSIDQLVAGTLLRYPLYVSRRSHQYATAEDIVDELLRGRQNAPKWYQRSWAARQLRKGLNLLQESTFAS